MSEWISVKQELPPKDEAVLIVTCFGIRLTAVCDGRRFSSVPGMYGYDKTVTHWMPLPEPPTES